MVRWLSCVCFFFKAEGGIRDLTVTGVQTCALPICARNLDQIGAAGEYKLKRCERAAPAGTPRVSGNVANLHRRIGRFQAPEKLSLSMRHSAHNPSARAIRPRLTSDRLVSRATGFCVLTGLHRYFSQCY